MIAPATRRRIAAAAAQGSRRPTVDGVVVHDDLADVVDWIRRSIIGRVIVLVLSTAVAFHYTVGSLLASLGADSPLAYLGLVPLIAMPVAFASARPGADEPEVADRHLDWIIGLPAILSALMALVVLPAQMSTFFWVWRIDVLLVPLFVAGVVALLFGVRTLYRIRTVVLFLLLAWPVPSRAALSLGLDHFTSWTVTAVTKATAILPVAHAIPNTEGAFTVDGPAGKFTVLVASACSGVNGLVGFLLVAVATLLVARGAWWRKAAWLVVGAALVWLTNVVRILLVFGVGRFWGEKVSIDVFHPYVGLVTFAVAVLAMVMLLPRFGLRFGERAATDRPRLADVATRAVPRIGRAVVFIIVVAVLMSLLDAQLRDVNPVASALGQPRIETFEQTAHVDGFDRARVDHFDWATRFFGDDSDWTRFQFSGSASGAGNSGLRSQIPIFADVVTTSNLQSFEDYDVEACYRFHGFGVAGVDQVDLGHGQVASVLSWKDPNSPIQWLSLYWFLPVVEHGEERYQRVVLLLDVSSAGEIAAAEVSDGTASGLGIAINDSMNGRHDIEPTSERDADLRRFLTAFGRELVSVAAANAATGAGDEAR